MTKKINLLVNECVSCVTKPCQLGCPLNNDIMAFIKEIKNKNYEEAFKVLANTSVLMPICGRICPHSKQCEGSCVKGISYKSVSIGEIETFIGDMWLKKDFKIFSPKRTTKKVAVIGSGPAGLTCAAFLRRNGVGVTIYEKHDYLGGVLMYGIPDFRLSKRIVREVVNNIIDLGIAVKYNQELGKNIFLNKLEKEYDAIFLGIGNSISNDLDIPGEMLPNVYGACEFLENSPKINYKNKVFVVIGGGNTAMDVARIIKKKGGNVIVLYRRSESLIKASKKEVKSAKKEGVQFIFLASVTKIIGYTKVNKIEYQDSTNNIHELVCDYVIKAIGSHPADLVKKLPILKKDNHLLIDTDGRTNKKKIYAGGDVAGVKETVAFAARSGRNAAYAIIEDLTGVDTSKRL